MPFKSQAQRRYFYWANKKGKISDKDLREWEKETPKGKKLPERLKKKKKKKMKKTAFWLGFEKAAIGNDQGKGFSAVGEGTNKNPIGQLEIDRHQGTQESHGRAEGEDTRTNKELLDRDRNPRDYSHRHLGPDFKADSVPIVY